ncbi:MAG: autotransporter domain-containing protein [Rhodanobacteraceae bacterium]
MLRPRHLACAVALALASSAVFAQSAPPSPQPSSVHAGMFDNVITFGDSLSDDGNFTKLLGEPFTNRFTTNPGTVTVENVAAAFGFTMTNSLSGGTDFAYGGAGMVNNELQVPNLLTIPQQLGAYLGATHGKADPNSLYMMWGGANDVFYLLDQVAAGKLTPQQAQAGIVTAAQTELGLIQQLGKAGARQVVVFNLPDIGKTPSFLALGPAGSTQGTGAAILYNNTLNTGLASAGTNIIPINTFGLVQEIIANPSRFGFVNVTNTACSGGVNSIPFLCGPQGSGMPYTYTPGTQNTYLFANGVHPTTGAHAILGQYVESVILAPGEMSLLGEAPLQIDQSLNRSITTQATSNLANAPGNGLRVWASYDYAHQRLDQQVNSPKSSNDVNTLSIGADIHPSDAMTAGLAFTAGQQKDDFAGNAGGFKLQDLLATAYVMWGWDQAYFGAIGSFGHLGYSGIHRNIPIGPTVLYESASTSGYHTALALTGGWWFDFGNWRTGPYADLSWQHAHVDGFSENGGDATAMTFGQQDRRALIGTLGWQVTANLQAGNTLLHPFARVAWNHDNDADARDVTAGLVSMPGTFALPGFMPDKNWGSVGVGLAADFTQNFSGWIGYDGRFSDSSQRLNSLNIGAKLKF